MKVLNEAAETYFNPFTDRAWLDVISTNETPVEEDMNEAYLKEDKYTDIETGTCFYLNGHPSVYQIKEIDPTTEQVKFQAYDHKYGNYWLTDVKTLDGYFKDGTFKIAQQDEIDKLYSYD